MKKRTLFRTSRPFARRMNFRNVLPLLTLSLVATACDDEPVVGPDVGAPSFSVHNGHGAVVQSVIGFGLFTEDGEPTTFSFTARRYADDSVEGEWERQNRSLDFRGHGDVICFKIDGDQAWIGDIIEQFPSDPGRVGGGAVWSVIDNGQGANADPDQITRTFNATAEGASAFCGSPSPIPPRFFHDLEAGNISVRG